MLKRTRSLACKIKNTQASHHRFAETFRPSLRNGFNGCFVLSLVIGFVATIPGAMRQHCHQVDAGIEASRPHDFAVREITSFVA